MRPALPPAPRPRVLRTALRTALVFLPLLALAWFAGARLGLPSVPARLGWMLFLLALWGVLATRGPWFQARRQARREEPAVPPDPVPPTGDPGAALQRRRLLQALAALGESRLGLTRGRAARYALPWYLVLGAPGSGKTSLVQGTDIRRTLAGTEAREPGAASPALCGWHFSPEAVLLDTPGGCGLDREDREAWLDLLRLLKAHRSRQPLDGVLLAMGAGDLLGPGAAAQARHVRQALGEMERIFRRRVPVYLVVTQMDRLRGFTGFFGSLPEDARTPAWGAVLPAGPGPGLARRVDERFQELCRGMEEAAADRLSPAAGAAQASFPLEFRALGEGLRAFAAALDEPDPYHPAPCLRAFHFTSARPGSGPRISAALRTAPLFGLPPVSLEEPPGPDRSWFLEELLRQVVVPDRRRAPFPAGQGAVAALAGLALLAGAWTWSFAGNLNLVREARAAVLEARALEADGTLAGRLEALAVLQPRLEELARHRRQGRPLGLRWGLYTGRRAERALRARYFAGLRQALLEPVGEQLERILAAAAGPGPVPREARRRAAGPDPEPAYQALKTYLMLCRRERRDRAHLEEQLPRLWDPWLRARQSSGPSPAPGGPVLAFYLDQLGEPDLPVLSPRPDLVARVRTRLRGTVRPRTPLEDVYAELRARGDARFEPLTLARILQRQDRDLVPPGCAVPGSFTREAWEGFFREAFREAGGGPWPGTDWVLEAAAEGSPGEDAETRRVRLEALYKADYARAWARFLQGLDVRPCPGAADAAAALGRLADPQASALKRVLARAAQETSWDNPSGWSVTLRSAQGKVLERTGRLLGRPAGPEPARPAEPGLLGAQYAQVAALVATGPAGPPPLDAYLERLQKVRARLQALCGPDAGRAARQWLQATLEGTAELAEGRQWVEALGTDGDGQGALRPLLLRPFTQAYAALLPGAGGDLEQAWAQQVYGPWTGLAGKYPFSDSENDAPMADILRFLKPGEGILPRFLDTHLGALAARDGDRLAPRGWGGRSLALSPAFLAGAARLCAAGACLGDGGPSRFELQPVPDPGLSEILLEIDGQTLRYRNGPLSWTGFAWPGAGPAQGARIQAVTLQGAGAEVRNAPGRLGLMRLLAQCRIERPEAPESLLEWRFSGTGGQARAVRFLLRRVSGPDPLRLAALRQHSLPARITR